MASKVFVIIVTYKGRRWYDKCFESLRKSTLPVEIVAVDNTPGDEDAEYIRTNHPYVHLIKTNDNLGFGRANNLGMRYAMDNGCDYVFLLNQDTWIETDTIGKLVAVANQHLEYGIISPMHINVDNNHLNFLLDDGNRNYELLSDLYFGCTKDSYPITYVNAAAWLLPRKTLETIGGFCPLIYHYGEDDDYMNRVRYHGLLMGLVPTARIVHDSGVRVDKSQELFEKANIENLDVFLDVNNTKSVKAWRRYFFWKCMNGLLHHENIEKYKEQYKVLRAKQKDIESCREAHKIKQANWL